MYIDWCHEARDIVPWLMDALPEGVGSNSQCPHGDSQLPVTPGLGNLTPLGASTGNGYTSGAQTCKEAKHP